MPQVQTGHTVETVTGPVDTTELGQTLMHEHVFVLNADVQQNYPEEWGSEDDRVADAMQKLTKLAATGVRTIVDPTVIGTPVARCALATARITRSTPAVMPWWSIAHLRTPARTPVPAIPFSMSPTNMSTTGSGTSAPSASLSAGPR